jgi:tetratricopeptide (TPR) repeat protein
MQNPNVYLDETNRRMTLNFRNNFSRLADALINSGKTDKAEIVLDKCLEIMPNDAVLYNYFNLPIVENYYKIGKVEKAREVMNVLIENYFDEIRYYQSIDSKTLSSMQREYNIANQIVGNLYSISNQYNDTETSDKIAELYQKYQD